MEGWAVGHNFEKDALRDHPYQLCLIGSAVSEEKIEM
jgi:hypothetical protein